MLFEKSSACESCTKGFKPVTAEKHLLMLEEGQSRPSGATGHCGITAFPSQQKSSACGTDIICSDRHQSSRAPVSPLTCQCLQKHARGPAGPARQKPRPILSSFQAVWTGQAGGLRTTLLFLKKLIFFWLYHVACGILVPRSGIKLSSPALEAQEYSLLDCQGIPNTSLF